MELAKKYQIVVDGTLAEGAQPDDVRKNIAGLFKTSLGKIEPIFSGKAIAVKKGLNAESAKKYMLALRQAGLICKAVAMEQAPAPSTAELDNTTLANVGAKLDDTPPAPPPNIDTSAYTISKVGETLIETTPVSEPTIDISAISMGEVGEDVMVHPAVPAANIDTSQLTVADAGEQIIEHQTTPDARIDTSQLKLEN